MAKMTRKLDQWTQAGLLTPDQASAILKFETEGADRRSWVLFGIVTIGIAAIVIGIISIIAANWQVIPPAAKLFVYLVVQAGLGALLFSVFNRPAISPLLREGTIGLFAFLFFAGIGLTAQIYNIRSDGWDGILFWCFLALPVTLFARTRPLNYLWMALLMTAETIWFTTRIVHFNNVHAGTNLTFVTVLTIYCYLAAGVFSIGRLRLPEFLGEAARVIAFLIIFIGGTILGNFLWYLGTEMVFREAGSDLDVLLRLQYV